MRLNTSWRVCGQASGSHPFSEKRQKNAFRWYKWNTGFRSEKKYLALAEKLMHNGTFEYLKISLTIFDW